MPKTKDKTVLSEFIKGGLVGCAVLVIITIAICSIILKTDLSGDTYFPLLMFASLLSGAVSGFVAVRKRRENGLVNGIAVSIIPAVTVLTAMTVAYNGFSIFEMIVAACCIFGGAVGGIAAVNIKKKRKHLKKR